MFQYVFFILFGVECILGVYMGKIIGCQVRVLCVGFMENGVIVNIFKQNVVQVYYWVGMYDDVIFGKIFFCISVVNFCIGNLVWCVGIVEVDI